MSGGVRVEIMGPGKYETVGKSQPVLVMSNPIISIRTRRQSVRGVRGGERDTIPCGDSGQLRDLEREGGRGVGGETAFSLAKALAVFVIHLLGFELAGTGRCVDVHAWCEAGWRRRQCAWRLCEPR